MNGARFFYYLLLFSFLVSCRKQLVDVDVSVTKIQDNIDIECISFLSEDTVLLCGGLKNLNGKIYMSVDRGKNWTQVFSCPDKLYDLTFNKNTGIAVGDSTRIQLSKDRGKTWEVQALGNYKMREWQNDQSSIRKIHFWDNNGIISISNQNHEHGNLYTSWDGGNNWSDQQGSNGLRDWWIFNNDSIYAVGYGILEKIEYDHQTGWLGYRPKVTPMKLVGDYFTGIWFTSDKVGYICGFNGGIYKTTDAGRSWKTIFKSHRVYEKMDHFNDILFVSDKTGYVIGEDGICLKTTNEGKDWNRVKIPSKMPLKQLYYNNGKVYITSEDGTYYQINENSF